MTGLRCSVSALALVLVGTAASAQQAPRGAAATDCDITRFTAITSDRTGEVLYWNNPTCPAPSGATDAPAPPAPPAPPPPAPPAPAPAPPAPPPPAPPPPADNDGGNDYDIV